MGGLEISYERIPISQYHSEDGNTGLLVEEVNMTVKVRETVSENHVRMSFVMEKMNGT